VKWIELALLALTGASLAIPTPDWARVEPGIRLEYPRDHGSHPAYRTEWWYLTGELVDEDGRRFGCQFTIFRSGIDPQPPQPGASPLRARELFAAHLAIADLESGRMHFAERLRRGGTALARASTERLELALEDWSWTQGAGERSEIRASDPGTGIGIELRLEPRRPLVKHGLEGWSAKGSEPGNASAYVSWTRIAVEGSLLFAGRARSVQGEAWFDHEFGSSVLGEGVAGWDWFGLRLDGSRELMLFQLRGEDGRARPASAGTLVEADGRVLPLSREDFELEVLAHWRSPQSGALYPARWRIRIPRAGLELELVPRIADAELHTRGSTGVTYWEGPVEVRGDASGSGYAELTGYAGSLAGRF
jgi:predicted secreted hydrolase